LKLGLRNAFGREQAEGLAYAPQSCRTGSNVEFGCASFKRITNCAQL
jgi:hypothetical protein